MTRAAQIICILLALFLGAIGLGFIFFPDVLAGRFGGSLPSSPAEWGAARATGGGQVMLAILLLLAAKGQDWKFVLPAALTFLVITIARIISLVLDGSEDGSLRPLIIAIVIFVLAEVALQVFRKAERPVAEG